MNNCQIFTPDHIVELMLDKIGYVGENIMTKTVFEPSFGNGAFLCAIVKRVLDYARERGLTAVETETVLSKIHGVEIDKKYYDETISKLNRLLSAFGLSYSWQNLINGNTLESKPNIKFDLIIGNPPYIRIHDLDEKTRRIIEQAFDFGTGNTDLYVVFFEYCLRCMHSTSKLCFITPNSFFKNSSQNSFRKYLSDNNLVESIIDYGDVKVFDNADTYAAITLLNFDKTSDSTHYTFMETLTDPAFTSSVNLKTFNGMPWVFTTKADECFLSDIESRKTKLSDLCDIQYGIATNADKVYIIGEEVSRELEQDILRPIVKGSTLDDSRKIIFPYVYDDELQKYRAIDIDTMMAVYPKTFEYLTRNKNVLERRDMESGAIWYQYARSQGIQNTNSKKLVLKHILSPEGDTCQFKELDEASLVYSGIYITVKNNKNYEFIREILAGKEFRRYLFLLGKNMSGGYKSVNAKCIKNYRIDMP